MDLALLYQKNNQLDEAANQYQAAASLDPKNFAAQYNLALIFWKQKKTGRCSRRT